LTAADPPAVSPGAAGTLYDTRRGAYYAKPAMRGWLHLLWFAASLVAGPLLVASGHGAARVTALAVYAASVTGLFGTSALYHRGTWAAAWSQRLQRLDHTMIFFLIAGTATPAFLITGHGAFGWVCLIVLWTLTIAAAALHLVWMHAPELLMGVTFIALGLVGGLALPAVWLDAGLAPGVLMLAGGVLYIGGAVSYHLRWDPVPAVFGYHEVFHACVCAAATCQYVSIALFIARVAG
jgi:hemolysin III